MSPNNSQHIKRIHQLEEPFILFVLQYQINAPPRRVFYIQSTLALTLSCFSIIITIPLKDQVEINFIQPRFGSTCNVHRRIIQEWRRRRTSQNPLKENPNAHLPDIVLPLIKSRHIDITKCIIMRTSTNAGVSNDARGYIKFTDRI